MSEQQADIFAVVADVGGTHIRFGTLTSPSAQLQCIEDFFCAHFAQMEDAVAHYLAILRGFGIPAGSLQLLCLALPGDTQTDPIELVNAPWDVHLDVLAKRFHCQALAINDFTAQGHAIATFQESELQWLRPPAGRVEGLNRAIFGPGTGFGVAGLLPGGQVVESEGGHISFAPQTRQQQKLLKALWKVYPRLSVERLISGPGLANIYQGLVLMEESMIGHYGKLQPEEITSRAQAGDRRCRKAVELFTSIFGSACGDLALALGAKGGVYLSGGLLNGLGDLFDSETFLTAFDNKGRYRDYCHQMPVARVLAEQPGLVGVAAYARQFATSAV